MRTELRDGTVADLDRLVAFMASFYAIDRYQFDEVVARRALAELLGDPALGRVWLIEGAGVALGYAAVTFGYSLEFGGRDAFLDELFIDAPHRGRRVGTRVLDLLLDRCRALGVRALHLEVEPANAAGLALYRRAGFALREQRLMTRVLAP